MDKMSLCIHFIVLLNSLVSTINVVCNCLESPDGKYSVKIGNREWMLKHELHVSDEINNDMEQHEEKGETVVLVCIRGM